MCTAEEAAEAEAMTEAIAVRQHRGELSIVEALVELAAFTRGQIKRRRERKASARPGDPEHWSHPVAKDMLEKGEATPEEIGEATAIIEGFALRRRAGDVVSEAEVVARLGQLACEQELRKRNRRRN